MPAHTHNICMSNPFPFLREMYNYYFMDQIGSNRAFSVSTFRADTTYILQLPAYRDAQELTLILTFYQYLNFLSLLGMSVAQNYQRAFVVQCTTH